MNSKEINAENNQPVPALKINPANELIFDYEIDTNEIVEEVKKQWKKFQIEDIKILSATLEEVLQKNEGELLIVDSEKDKNYFKKIIEEENTYYNEANAGRIPPIPDFYVQKRDRFKQELLLADSPIRLSPADAKAFRVFFSFKLATIEVELLDEFIDYVYKRHFNQSFPEFEKFMLHVFSEHQRVINNRKPQIEKKISQLKAEYESLQKMGLQGENADLSNDNLTENDDLVGATERRRVLAIKYMLEYIYQNHTESRPPLTEIARFINFVLGKNDNTKIQKTNIYKFLHMPLTKRDSTNIKNLQFVKIKFEQLMLRDLIELVNKEIKNTN